MPEIDLSNAQFLDLATEILERGHSLRFRARGVSMRPFIRDGDLLEIHPLDWRQVRRGDILLFRVSPRQTLVHRVMQVRRQAGTARFLLQGDAVLQPDGWIEPGQVLGRVERIERERMSTFDGEGSKVGRLEGLQVENQELKQQGKVIVLATFSQRLFALILALGLPLYKRGYRLVRNLSRGG